MRYVLVLSVALIGCGPSKAERAASDCKSAHTAKDWLPATSACEQAVRLSPADPVVADLYADAFVRRHGGNVFSDLLLPQGLPDHVVALVKSNAQTMSAQSAASRQYAFDAAASAKRDVEIAEAARDISARDLALAAERQADAAERQARALERNAQR